jgi:hypothetical protein
MAPCPPRPASVRPSSAAALFPPLCPTGQTGFSAPGRSFSSPSRGRGRRARLGTRLELELGAGPTVCPLFVPPRGGEGLNGRRQDWPTRPRSSPAPSVRPSVRWATPQCQMGNPPSAPSRFAQPVIRQFRPLLPAGAAVTTPPHQPRVTFPPSTGLAAARGR